MNLQAVRKKQIRDANVAKRLEFAQFHVSRPLQFWKNILWSDDFTFKLYPKNRLITLSLQETK